MNLNQEMLKELSEKYTSDQLKEILDESLYHLYLREIWLKPFVSGVFLRNEDNTYSVNGTVYYAGQEFKKIPLKFKKVSGTFDVSRCLNLQSLEGSPEECAYFRCDSCKNLKTFKFSPRLCKSFSGSDTKVASLKGSPEVCEIYTCHNCSSLKTLKGAPLKCIHLYVNYAFHLESIKGVTSELETLDISYCESLKYLDCERLKVAKLILRGCESLLSLKGNVEYDSIDISYCFKLENLEGIATHYDKITALGIYMSHPEFLKN